MFELGACVRVLRRRNGTSILLQQNVGDILYIVSLAESMAKVDTISCSSYLRVVRIRVIMGIELGGVCTQAGLESTIIGSGTRTQAIGDKRIPSKCSHHLDGIWGEELCFESIKRSLCP